MVLQHKEISMQFSFKAQFVPQVALGILEHSQQPAIGRICHPPLDMEKAMAARASALVPKRQTIRLPRKDGKIAQPGEQLHLCTGARTKAYRKLGTTTCIYAVHVTFGLNKGFLTKPKNEEEYKITKEWFLRVMLYSPFVNNLDAIAIADGFENWQAMCEYFDATTKTVNGVMTWW